MAVKSIVEGITEYFLQCPLLQDGIFRVDALGQDAVEYVIETGICDPIIALRLLYYKEATKNE